MGEEEGAIQSLSQRIAAWDSRPRQVLTMDC
jgi:hypothetical protein